MACLLIAIILFIDAIFNKGGFLGQIFKHARMTSGSNAEMTSMYSSCSCLYKSEYWTKSESCVTHELTIIVKPVRNEGSPSRTTHLGLSVQFVVYLSLGIETWLLPWHHAIFPISHYSQCAPFIGIFSLCDLRRTLKDNVAEVSAWWAMFPRNNCGSPMCAFSF